MKSGSASAPDAQRRAEQSGQTGHTGRFAPAPTGPLHFGSLVTALASWLDARAAGGRWLLRIEDIDHPRVVAGADSLILRTLERLGLHWDGPVVYQSHRREAYADALGALERSGRTFPCACTRREVGPGQPYPGRCRDGLPQGREARSVRLRVDDTPLSFEDRIQGVCSQNLRVATGDFVVRRADALVAYHLAVVHDDAEQGVSHVLRGADLIDSTPRQIHLQRALGLPTPRYAHLPVACGRDGAKLSKQNHAPAVDPAQGSRVLRAALAFLGQCPPACSRGAEPQALLDWALANWDIGRVPALTALPAPAP